MPLEIDVNFINTCTIKFEAFCVQIILNCISVWVTWMQFLSKCHRIISRMKLKIGNANIRELDLHATKWEFIHYINSKFRAEKNYWNYSNSRNNESWQNTMQLIGLQMCIYILSLRYFIFGTGYGLKTTKNDSM